MREVAARTGLGDLPVTDPSYVFASASGYAGFGADPHGDLVDFYGPPFISTYALDTDVSPISVSGQAGGGLYGDMTSSGSLVFYDAGDTVLSAEVTPVPEPASWVVMLLGIGVVGASARARRGGERRSGGSRGTHSGLLIDYQVDDARRLG